MYPCFHRNHFKIGVWKPLKLSKQAGNQKPYITTIQFVTDSGPKLLVVASKFSFNSVVLGFRSFMVSKTGKPEKPEKNSKQIWQSPDELSNQLWLVSITQSISKGTPQQGCLKVRQLPPEQGADAHTQNDKHQTVAQLAMQVLSPQFLRAATGAMAFSRATADLSAFSLSSMLHSHVPMYMTSRDHSLLASLTGPKYQNSFACPPTACHAWWNLLWVSSNLHQLWGVSAHPSQPHLIHMNPSSPIEKHVPMSVPFSLIVPHTTPLLWEPPNTVSVATHKSCAFACASMEWRFWFFSISQKTTGGNELEAPIETNFCGLPDLWGCE